MMETIKDYPPNIEEIEKTFGAIVRTDPIIFTYGDKIYNPKGIVIQDHLLAHELVHKKQQDNKPKEWWTRYLDNIEFRLEQELEAYATQYNFVKHIFPTKVTDNVLYQISTHLSSELYGKIITQSQAHTKIRNMAKVIQ